MNIRSKSEKETPYSYPYFHHVLTDLLKKVLLAHSLENL